MSIEVTENAKMELLKTLERLNLEEGQYLRLTTPPSWTGPGDFGIVLDTEQDFDTKIEFNEHIVLLINDQLLTQHERVIFDFKETPEGLSFALDIY
tara:strand:+ start:1856 stop:2143 length:288 start_codon:yes stop_codon:yes gene_type:complete